jgi:DNA polymerase III subunit epsilon
MLVTLLDVETTGLSPDTAEVIEVGAVLYSVEHRAIVQQVSTLLPVDKNPAYEINGITPAVSQECAGPELREAALDLLRWFNSESEYLVAFNSDFDSKWFNGSVLPDWSVNGWWSDAAAIRYPKPSTSRSLIALCVAHGIPVVSAHRALDDCRLLAALLGTVDDLAGELERAARPKALVRALVPFERKEEAKAEGFIWNELVPRAWAKWMPIEDAEGLPFEVVEVVAPTVGDVLGLAQAEREW